MWGFERIIEGERKRKNRFSCWRMRAAGIVLFDDEASFFLEAGRDINFCGGRDLERFLAVKTKIEG
jgi:hypothetical protein